MKLNLDSSKPSEITLTGVNLVLSTEGYDLLPDEGFCTPRDTVAATTTHNDAAAPAEGADAESGGGVLGGVGNLVNLAK